MINRTLRNERLTELAEFFEAGAPHFKFDITTGFEYKGGDIHQALDGECQTAGCIAGFVFPKAVADLDPAAIEAGAVLGDEPDDGTGEWYQADWFYVKGEAQRYLGLTDDEAYDLFMGYRQVHIPGGRVTPREAANAVRNVMAGRPAWKRVMALD